jgi:hypothetical protein
MNNTNPQPPPPPTPTPKLSDETQLTIDDPLYWVAPELRPYIAQLKSYGFNQFLSAMPPYTKPS